MNTNDKKSQEIKTKKYIKDTGLFIILFITVFVGLYLTPYEIYQILIDSLNILMAVFGIYTAVQIFDLETLFTRKTEEKKKRAKIKISSSKYSLNQLTNRLSTKSISPPSYVPFKVSNGNIRDLEVKYKIIIKDDVILKMNKFYEHLDTIPKFIFEDYQNGTYFIGYSDVDDGKNSIPIVSSHEVNTNLTGESEVEEEYYFEFRSITFFLYLQFYLHWYFSSREYLVESRLESIPYIKLNLKYFDVNIEKHFEEEWVIKYFEVAAKDGIHYLEVIPYKQYNDSKIEDPKEAKLNCQYNLQQKKLLKNYSSKP